MRINTDNQGTWTVCSQTRDEEEFLKFLFDALDARCGGHHLYTNFPDVSQDEISAILGLSESQTQNKSD